MTDISEILDSIQQLTPISPTVVEIVTIADQPEVGTAKVAEIVNRDPAMATNVLRAVNSAYYGLSKKIDDVRSAVTVLGTRQIVEMIFLKAVAEKYARRACPGYALETGKLWENAILSSEVAKSIARHLKHPMANRIFTATLIRDIGKIVLDQFVSTEMDRIHQTIADEKISYNQAEKAVLGIDHADLGALVLRRWSFPESIVQIIERHHDEQVTVLNDSDTAIVQAADAICSMMGGAGADGMSYKIGPDVSQGLLPEGQIEMLIGMMLASKNRIFSRVISD